MGICPPSLAAAGGPVFVEYLNIIQTVVPTSLTTIAVIDTGETGLQLMIIGCNFIAPAVPVGYDLKVRPSAEVSADKHFFRGSNTSTSREMQAGTTEFWEFYLRPREEYIVEAQATLADALAMTLSTSQLFNSGAPEVCPP